MRPVRVLVAGHDIGGLNVLAPLLAAWIGELRIQVRFAGTRATRRELADRVPELQFATGCEALTEQILHHPEKLDEAVCHILGHNSYDVVLCSTSMTASLERRLFAAARMAGVPSIAICDMWAYYRERFTDGGQWYLPDRLWTLDERMRSEAANVAWSLPLRIEVVGSPLFCSMLVRRRLSGETQPHNIRFISEPVSSMFPEAGIDEFELAEWLVDAARGARLAAPIKIRPHPLDSQEAWRRWCWARRHDGISIDTLPFDEAVADTALAVGISSIMLAQLSLSGVPTASLQPPSAKNSYLCLPFDELAITRVGSRSQLAAWCRDPRKPLSPAYAELHMSAIEKATARLFDTATQNRRASA